MNKISQWIVNVFLLVFLFLSCKGKTAEAEMEKTMDMPAILSLADVHTCTGEELLSVIGDEIVYIPLETVEEGLLRNVFKMCLLKNGNMIISDNQNLCLFDSSGKLIRSVSQRGNGPGDYTRIGGLAANPLTGGFFVQSNQKVMEFDEEGMYVRHFATQDRPMDMVIEADGNILLHRMNVPKSQEDTTTTWMLYRYSPSGEELIRFADLSPRMAGEGIIPMVMPMRPLYLYDGQVRFNELGNDTIFIVGEQSLLPYTVLDLGTMKMSATPKGTNVEVVMNELSDKLNPAFLTEDKHFLYMVFGWGFGGDYLYSTYNKKTGRLVSYGNGGLLDTKVGLTNNLDGGLPFYPFFVDPNGTRIMCKSAYDFKNEILDKDYEAGKNKFGEKFEKVWTLANSLREDDNPVLILIP